MRMFFFLNKLIYFKLIEWYFFKMKKLIIFLNFKYLKKFKNLNKNKKKILCISVDLIKIINIQMKEDN